MANVKIVKRSSSTESSPFSFFGGFCDPQQASKGTSDEDEDHFNATKTSTTTASGAAAAAAAGQAQVTSAKESNKQSDDNGAPVESSAEPPASTEESTPVAEPSEEKPTVEDATEATEVADADADADADEEPAETVVPRETKAEQNSPSVHKPSAFEVIGPVAFLVALAAIIAAILNPEVFDEFGGVHKFTLTKVQEVKLFTKELFQAAPAVEDTPFDEQQKIEDVVVGDEEEEGQQQQQQQQQEQEEEVGAEA